MSIDNIHRNYLYHIDKDKMVIWYAGLGKPWKISHFPKDAVSVQKSQINNVRKGLETFTGKEWLILNGSIHNQQHTQHCQSCGTSWTEVEEAYAKRFITTQHTAEPLPIEIPISSLLRNRLEKDDFEWSIRFKSNCKVCGDLLCGACPTPRNGRNSGRCKNCKKKSWEK